MASLIQFSPVFNVAFRRQHKGIYKYFSNLSASYCWHSPSVEDHRKLRTSISTNKISCQLNVNSTFSTSFQSLNLHSGSSEILRLSQPLPGSIDKNTIEEDHDNESVLIAKAEVSLMKEEGLQELPNNITPVQWEELATRKSYHSKKKYLRYLFLTEIKIMQKKKKKEERAEQAEINWKARIADILENEHLTYGLWNNSFCLKWTKSRMMYAYNHALISARLLGQPIILDHSYDHLMQPLSKSDLVRQLSMGINLNRIHIDPFYLHICNFNLKDDSAKKLLKSIPTMLDAEYPMDTHPECYMDLFPHDKLVYLTPHCEEELLEFDHDAIYIIGNFVDKGTTQHATLAKAKRQNIKMKKFPLDRFLDWGNGSKSLTINQSLGLMLEFRNTGSWVQAFARHIPSRKLYKQQHNAEDVRRAVNKSRHSLLGEE